MNIAHSENLVRDSKIDKTTDTLEFALTDSRINQRSESLFEKKAHGYITK